MLDLPPLIELNKNEAIADVSTIEDHITGQAYWRSLEEQANAPELLDQLGDEFQGYDPEEIQAVSRRTFLKLAGASLALAGLTLSGCRRWPKEELAPFAARPEDLIPGVPNYFASMAERSGVAHPMLVASFDGRPIKVEGHPMAGFATDVYDQALTLQQYDPERLRDVLIGEGDDGQGGKNISRSSWTTFEAWMTKKADEFKADGGAKFAVLAEPTSSPTALRLKAKLKAAMPQMSWVTYEPLGQDSVIEGSKLAFEGKAVRTQYDVSKAKVIACFDSDFLCNHPSATRNAKGWAVGRKSVDTEKKMNRMYVVESAMTITGAAADERLPIQPSRVAHVLTYIAGKLGVPANANVELTEIEKAFAGKLAKDLIASGSNSVIVAGASQPADVHASIHAINKKLGTTGVTTTYSDEPTAEESWQLQAFDDLGKKMGAGEIDTLLILGGNPAFDAPRDIFFTDMLEKVPHTIKLGLYRDETAAKCDWALPAATSFECWGDGRWYDGTLAVQQPLILPLFNGRSTIELLASILGDRSLQQPSGYDLVRETFKSGELLKGAAFAEHLTEAGYAAELSGFEKDWRRAVHLGFVPGSAFKPVFVDAKNAVQPKLKESAEFEVVFVPSAVYDGRFANSPWLQEAPDPITKVTWDNPLLMSVPDMKEKGLINADQVTIKTGGGEVQEIMVFGQPGQAKGTVIAQLGNGRNQQAGSVGQGVGTDVYPLRVSGQMGFMPVQEVSDKTGSDYLAYTSVHHLVDGLSPEVDETSKWALEKRAGKKGKSGKKGNIIKEGKLKDWKEHPEKIMGHAHGDLSLQLYQGPSIYEDGSYDRKHPDGPEAFNHPHAWGMTIDLTSCLGCNSCVIACQAENNIPSVGKKQVWRSREMHWQRTDTYYKGDPDKPEDIQVVHQPVSCVQCENAPCEQVCPVAATVHDTEGLNTMVYNRCIGTRYCSNNCPYKVRRFNYFDYHAKSVRKDFANPWLNIPDTQQDKAIDQIKRMVFNPDVTVRMRGVMEKCTYCTQRIQRAKIQQKNAYVQSQNEGGFTHDPTEQKTVPDGTIVVACQDACPTDCISFGDLNDPESKVAKIQYKNKRVYGMLDELNTRPRTKYLAKIRNPHP
ncbi:MAG: TAT-variant-translocated molybdopterin oxidoreductase [Planctomycetota bacterium]